MMSGNDGLGDLGLDEAAAPFASPSQRARVWTEGWAARALYCPNCGADRLNRFPPNRRVADFSCSTCSEQYELKAQKGRFGTRVVDGAYSAMLERLAAQDNPNLLLMNYDPRWLCVTDLIVVPKHFFTVQMIEPRKPLGPQARRAGWQGCNIRIDGLPASGRIVLVRSGEIIPKADVLASWRETLFLRNATLPKRGWLVEVMRCVERIGRPEFTLDDVYSFESELAERFPGNRNVRPKIRQQLQVLRDQGWLRFESRGRYRLVSRG